MSRTIAPIPSKRPVLGSRTKKVRSDTGIASSVCQCRRYVSPLPATLLHYGWTDRIGKKSPLIGRDVIRCPCVLDGMIQGQTHHFETRRIDVNRFPVRIYYANEVHRVFEKRYKYLTLILSSFAF